MNKKTGRAAALITMMLSVILLIAEIVQGGHQFYSGNVISYASLFLFAFFLFLKLKK